MVQTDVAFNVFRELNSIAWKGKPLDDVDSRKGYVHVPGSPEYAMSRCGLSVLILSSSTFIFTIDRAAVVSAATITYPFPVIANEVSMVCLDAMKPECNGV